MDERTLRIPIPKPTVDARKAVAASAVKQAEETRQQLRKAHQAGVKKGKFERHSIELEEVSVSTLHLFGFEGNADGAMCSFKSYWTSISRRSTIFSRL